MNELKIFENAEFGQVRTVTIDNEPWFVGKDVAEALGYSDTNKAVAMHVEEEDKKLNDKSSSSFGQRGATLINESGLYALIFGSKLESAKRFKHWVTSEVLPAIRKTGSYQKPKSALEQLQLAQQAILEVDEKITAVDEDLQNFKQDMPILGIEESRITAAVRKKGVNCLGGKESEAYQDKSLRGKVYADIYSQLKREFGVATYKAIKRSQCESAVSVIQEYELPIVLKEQITDCNAQMCI
ncbi:ORF6C domain-containing protein [Blautia coccoides]|uniref:ORF6C domain-containing protein n=1 Tax=Blautia producta TaxID=33035 RepID=UPI002149EC36|nr:ORF6C domain-containing protein [Blautia coccoides]MCR1986819.1 ORF6C domain-containing protein [Blautia coccoides]